MTVMSYQKPVPGAIASDAVVRLSELAPDIENNAIEVALLLADYKRNLETICGGIDQNEYIGLLDLIVILEEGIDELIAQQRPLDEFEIMFLTEFPALLSDYLEMPGSKIAASILVKYFKKSNWIRPITLDEQKMLMAYILHGEPPKQEENSDSESIEIEQYVSSEQKLRDETDLNLKEESVNIDDFINIGNSTVIEEGGYDSVNNDLSLEKDNAVCINEFLENMPELEIAENTENNTDIENKEEVCLDDFMANMPDRDVALPTENDSQAEEIDDAVSVEAIDSHQQELIDLVKQELMEIVEDVDQLNLDDQVSLKSALLNMSEQAENVCNAINLMGLVGIGESSGFISENLKKYSESKDLINAETLEIICKWPGQLLACMENIYDEENVERLVTYLSSNIWIIPLEDNKREELITMLGNPSFAEEEVESRQTVANEEDVRLDLPDEVNQELLDGLLQDLPAQTEEFSRAIQSINEGGGFEDIEVAQRIAHTLKGAANVVGVRGIANLTHHLEDILELLAKAEKRPVPSLMEVIINASDCLEGMSEALLGIDAGPDNAVAVLQSVLDWANKLDKEGVPDFADSVQENEQQGSSAVSEKELSVRSATHEKDSTHVENMLRVPATLADELLRLTGESLISTGQVQEHIKNLEKSQDAIQLHNQSLQQISYDLEHLIDIQGVASQINNSVDSSEFDPLEMDQYNEMHSVSRRLIEIAADSIQLSSNLDNELTKLHDLVIGQTQLQKESQELVLRTRMVPTKTIIPRLRRGVRQACRVTGKLVELDVDDNDTYMDSEVLNDLIEPLMHVLRNAVDHGIETSDVRKKAGKSEMGKIQLSFIRIGDQIIINIEDDGRGLDLDSIRTKAIANGIIRPEADLTDEAISRLVLEAGLSTRNEVTQVSGRGIGLDVVSVKIRELKGSINIYSEYGNGCRFELILPISSFSTHSLLVRVREHIYAISNRGIEEILYPGLGELCEIGEESIFQIEGQAYGAMLIDDLLDFSDDRRKIDRSNRPILLVREESGAKTAILVQEVLDSRDVVVKSMGHYLPKLRGIIGATVLGDGSVAPVMDLPELLQHRSAPGQRLNQSGTQKDTNISRLPYVLVVDDSLSARRSLAQFVQDLGMDVRTARDGMEAVSLIEARQPDLMLVDMEMPRMNGLELTSHVRASSNTNKLPVIMITSRSTDKHRAAAMEKGVNHFMVKPFAEEELAQYIIDVLDIAS